MPPIRPLIAGLALVAALSPAGEAAGAPAEAERWLAGLHDRVAADLAAGRPLVVQAHVPLCDQRILHCGNARLGDGDAPATNLYWSTSGGFRGWFNRRGSGWTEVHRSDGEGDVLEVRVWRRRIAPGRAFRERGVRRGFTLFVVAYAWRGTAIRAAMDAFVTDLYGDAARALTLADGTVVRAGGAAHVVGYVGHNGWMDFPDYDVAAVGRRAGGSSTAKGAIALACLTEPYLADALAAEIRVPLLMTRSLLFAGAHAFEGTVSAFARGEGFAGIRRGAAENHAAGQRRPVERVRGAFSNPAHPRWRRR